MSTGPATAQLEQLRLEIRRAAVRRRLTYADVGRLAGLHARTAERALEGETRNVDTLNALARALRVEVKP